MRTSQNVLTLPVKSVPGPSCLVCRRIHTNAHTGVNRSTHPWLILLHLYQSPQPRGVDLLLFYACLILVSIIHVSYLCQTRRLKISGDQQKSERHLCARIGGVGGGWLRKKRDNPLQIYLQFLQAPFRCRVSTLDNGKIPSGWTVKTWL